MFLSDLTQNKIFVGNTERGVCCGIGISLKNHTVKYLFCTSEVSRYPEIDYAVNVSAVQQYSPFISLARLRPIFPKNADRLFIGRPIYSYEGTFLGSVEDAEIKDFIVTRIYSDRNESFPITSVCACSDAVILRKEQPFPLGQRVPAPLLPLVTEKNDAVVTKPILKTAIKNKALIKLTLSLPPFRFPAAHR